MTARWLGLAALPGLVAAGAWGMAADASTPPSARTVLVSADNAGNPMSRVLAYKPTISNDGRLIPFMTTARLLNTDQNESIDVYVRDVAAGVTSLVSAGADGQAVGGLLPSISGDGRYVAYTAFHGTSRDVVVRELATGQERTASLANDGTHIPHTHCDNGSDMSADGRYVVMTCDDSLQPGTTVKNGIWLRDLVAGTTVNITPPPPAGSSNVMAGSPSISDDGSRVAFSSSAHLAPGPDPRGTPDVFVRDVAASTTEMVSVDNRGNRGAGINEEPEISGNGQVVVFTSNADNLAGGPDNDGVADVFTRDLVSGRTSLISDGCLADCDQTATSGSISASGRFVSFDSRAMFVPDGTEPDFKAYVVDRSAHTIALVARANPDRPASVFLGHLSGNGRDFEFASTSKKLVSGSDEQLFVRLRWANGPSYPH